jgi:hypothetical protein
MGTFVIGNVGNNGNNIPNNKGADCQQCVPEPASLVPISVVSDISDDKISHEIGMQTPTFG